MANVSVLVGAQWGDEGKGKWIDILAETVDLVSRYQGGNNAGHTIYVNGEKVVLHQIPSGIFKPHQICALSAGVVVNPGELNHEIAKVKKFADVNPERLWLSARCHVITPWHVFLDGKQEGEQQKPIGTTKQGIGPTYTDKASRSGLRLGEFVYAPYRQEWLGQMKRDQEFRAHYEANPDLWADFEASATALAPFVCDAESRIRERISNGERLLLEGAQGALLDIDHGTYPFVTSSATSTGGALASLGFSPRLVGRILGVAKAYVTRVGEGPLPTELHDDDGRFLAENGNEFGATTGRPRRCGWLDAVALKYSIAVGGYDQIILNKLDVLTGLKAVKICTAYEHPELGVLKEFPWDYRVLEKCQPIYQTYDGWHTPIPSGGRFSDLPQAALKYIQEVSRLVGCEVAYVGTGVGPKDFLAP